MHEKRQLLFIQGGGRGAHDEWDNQLVESLQRALGEGYEIRYPRMPNEDTPSYVSWSAALAQALEKLPDGSILVGHSVGGTILLKVLTAHGSKRNFGALFLIATPFVGDGGWSSDELKLPPDLGSHLSRGVPIHFYHGLADETAPALHVDLYARAVPQAHVHRLPGRDHQLNNDLKEVAETIASLKAG